MEGHGPGEDAVDLVLLEGTEDEARDERDVSGGQLLLNLIPLQLNYILELISMLEQVFVRIVI